MSRQPRRRFFQLPWRSAERIRTEIDEELQFELDMRTEELVRQGVSEAEARSRALLEFGDIEQTRRYCADTDMAAQRSERRTEWLAELGQDVRLAWRGMRRSPGFALVVLATLAVGIGANTAVYSVVRKVVLEPLPYSDPESLVRLYGGSRGNPSSRRMLAPAEIADLQQSRALASVAPFGMYGGATYVGDQKAEMWSGVEVGPDFFRVLGVHAFLGRTIDSRDMEGGPAPVVVISHRLWQRTFGGDSSIVGRDVLLDGHSRTVIGVLPATFISPDRDPEIWTPLDLRRFLRDPVTARQNRVFRAVGRLADGITEVELHSALALLAHRAEAQYPELPDLAPVNAVPLHSDMVRDARPSLLVVMGAAAVVLLIACVNVAGLFLSRATARRRELAVRAALGAGRARLVRQLLTESAVIAVAGGAIGVALAFWGKSVLVSATETVLPRIGDVRISAGVLAFALAISLLSALLFGIVPAMAATRFGLHRPLGESSRGSSGGRATTRAGRLLVVTQVTLAVVLLVGAGLLGRTLFSLERTGVGYDTGPQLLAFGVSLASGDYENSERQEMFFDRFLDRIRRLPGVRAAAAVYVAPWAGYTAAGPDSIIVEGGHASASGEDVASRVTVSDEYFRTLGIPIRRGRVFTAQDRDGSARVAVVSESVARHFWPGANALGQYIRIGGSRAPLTKIVGVVADIREHPGDDLMPTVYVSMRQNPAGGAAIVVRGTGNAIALVPAIQRELHDVDRVIPLSYTRTLQDIFDGMLGGQRLPLIFVAAFASLALVLAALGVYSVLAYAVASRQREFGIRAALGARRGNVIGLVMREGMAMAVIGTAAGLFVAAWGTRVLAGLLVGVAPRDPITFAAIALILLAVSAVACFIPARRATRADPVEALRAE